MFPKTSMHLKHFPLIGTEIEICSVHRCIGTVFFTSAFAGFIWDCLGTALQKERISLGGDTQLI